MPVGPNLLEQYIKFWVLKSAMGFYGEVQYEDDLILFVWCKDPFSKDVIHWDNENLAKAYAKEIRVPATAVLIEINKNSSGYEL